jgi:hypothetical protein
LNGNRFATDEIGFGRPSVGDPQHHAGWAFVDSRGMAGKTAFVTGAWAEFDFQYIEAARKGGRPIGGRPYAWHVEGGLYRGPIKLSLAHFLKTGHDRRGGTYDQSDRVDAAVGSQGAIQVYDK